MNGLAQITIDGHPVVLKFGLPALREIIRRYATVEMTVGEEYSELGVTHILFAGYLNGCALKDLVPTLPFERFYVFVEHVDEEEVKKEIITAMRAFEESKVIKDHLNKKKATITEEANPLTGTE